MPRNDYGSEQTDRETENESAFGSPNWKNKLKDQTRKKDTYDESNGSKRLRR